MGNAEKRLFESKVRICFRLVPDKILIDSCHQIDTFTLHMGRGNQSSLQKLRTVPSTFGETVRLEKDVENAAKLVAKFEVQSSDDRGSVAIQRKVETLRETTDLVPTDSVSGKYTIWFFVT